MSTKTFLSARVKEFSNTLSTPHLIIDLDQVRKKYRLIKKLFNFSKIFYAVKANPHKRIIETLSKEGSGFEINSFPELQLLIKSRVSPSKIISSGTIKKPDFIREAYEYGVDRFAVDSIAEIEKIAKFAPRSSIYIRVEVSNKGSEWPLTRKFGVPLKTARELYKYAQSKKLRAIGLTFHPGSQCMRILNWRSGLSKVAQMIKTVDNKNNFSLINIGGGIPIQHTRVIPQISKIAASIQASLKKEFPDAEVHMEPGRAVVGDSGTMVASVIGVAKRSRKNWLYLDVGVLNGLFETIEGFDYEVLAQKRGSKKNWVVAGPSCDSIDVIFKSKQLPNLDVGDRLFIMNTGAYTTAYGSNFNGYPPPQISFLQ